MTVSERRAQRTPTKKGALHRGRLDVIVWSVYALLAMWVLSRLIVDPRGTYLSHGIQDQQEFEWFFGATAHGLVTGSNPLFSTLLNFPTGVNMIANPSVMGLGVPLAPLTLIAGPHATFIVVEWLGLTATAGCWYLLFRRHLLAGRLSASVGGFLCGFSPGMISHANGHANFVAQFLIPVIIDRLLDLQRPRTRAATVRAGVILGLLVTWQLWIGEEVLVLATIGIALAGVAMLLHRRLDIRAILPGMLVGVLTVAVTFGWPVWWQFAGPQSYTQVWNPVANNDLAALWGRATRTVLTDPWASAALSMNRTEENAFFGIPLWIVLLVIVVTQWRSALVRSMTVVVIVTSWLSLGTEVTLYAKPTPIPSIWPLLAHLPLVDSLLPTRLTLVTAPAMATVLVVGLEAAARWIRGAPTLAHGAGWARGRARLALVAAGVLVGLLPVFPTRLWADPRPGVPEFFTQGTWRHYVDDGSVLAVPPPDIGDLRATDWQAAASWGFPLVEGYFLGPDGSGTGMSARGAIRRPFSVWLGEVGRSGVPRMATGSDRERFLADLRAWQTDLVVLPPRDNQQALLTSAESVLGPGSSVGGVVIWDVRYLPSG